MALSFLYLMARWFVGMLLGRLRIEQTKDVEIAVLRHQLQVLRPWGAEIRALPVSWRFGAA